MVGPPITLAFKSASDCAVGPIFSRFTSRINFVEMAESTVSRVTEPIYEVVNWSP